MYKWHVNDMFHGPGYRLQEPVTSMSAAMSLTQDVIRKKDPRQIEFPSKKEYDVDEEK